MPHHRQPDDHTHDDRHHDDQRIDVDDHAAVDVGHPDLVAHRFDGTDVPGLPNAVRIVHTDLHTDVDDVRAIADAVRGQSIRG